MLEGPQICTRGKELIYIHELQTKNSLWDNHFLNVVMETASKSCSIKALDYGMIYQCETKSSL